MIPTTPGLFRWRAWRWLRWVDLYILYSSGLTSGGGVSGSKWGWLLHNPHWRGKRVYILWIKRRKWGYPWHLLRTGHWPNPVIWGICGKCCPWPCCGATGYDHVEGCEG